MPGAYLSWRSDLLTALSIMCLKQSLSTLQGVQGRAGGEVRRGEYTTLSAGLCMFLFLFFAYFQYIHM